MVDADDDILLVILDAVDDVHDMLHAGKRRRDRHLDPALPRHLDRRLLGVLRPVPEQLLRHAQHHGRRVYRHHDRHLVHDDDALPGGNDHEQRQRDHRGLLDGGLLESDPDGQRRVSGGERRRPGRRVELLVSGHVLGRGGDGDDSAVAGECIL